MALIDTHAHLDFPDYAGDLHEVLKRAQAAGVQAIVTIGIDLASSRAAVKLAERYPQVYATVGVHPNESNHFDDDVERELRLLARSPRVVGIGETGFDLYRKRVPVEVQSRSFVRHLEIAKDTGLPIVVHNREAHDRTIEILGNWVRGLGPDVDRTRELGVIHCFSGDIGLARKLVSLGFIISIAGPVTYKNSGATSVVARDLPLENLLLETDAPFLAPQSWRGKRNESAYMVATAQAVAGLRQVPLETVETVTTQNATRVFRLTEATML